MACQVPQEKTIFDVRGKTRLKTSRYRNIQSNATGVPTPFVSIFHFQFSFPSSGFSICPAKLCFATIFATIFEKDTTDCELLPVFH